MAEWIALVVLVPAIVSIPVAWVLLALRLRRHHPDLWSDLGRGQDLISAGLPVAVFIWGRSVVPKLDGITALLRGYLRWLPLALVLVGLALVIGNE